MAAAVPRIYECVLPEQWYSHEVQNELLAAGIKMPVYKEDLAKVMADLDGMDPEAIRLPGSSDIVYVPHFGDKSLEIIHDTKRGNPLAEFDQSKMCILITPPIIGLDYAKFKHGIPVLGDDICDDPEIAEELVTVVNGYLPYSFRESALHAQDVSLRTFMRAMNYAHKFEIVGAKLSPLSSGKANIAMFIKFDKECPFDQQIYIPIRGSNMKIRVIPKPIIVNNSSESMKNIEIVVNVANVDESLFDYAHTFANNIITHDLKINLKHVRVDKANKNLIIVGHSRGEININTRMHKMLAHKITQGLIPYIVKKVDVNVFEGLP